MERPLEATSDDWASWDCPACGVHNVYRGFCSGCRAQLGSVRAPVPAVEADPPVESQTDAAGRKHGSGRSKKMAMVAAALVGVLVLAGGAAGGYKLATRSSVHYPSKWDPRVADLVSFVERERGLTFKHAVEVDFLTAAQYHDAMTTDSTKVSAADRKEIDSETGLLRAVGLVSGKVDLLDAANKLSDDGTLAAYHSGDKLIRIRGTVMTPALQVTLVHELTHVAQDQYFDLNRKLSTDAIATTFRALAEGDAERIEGLYADQLSAADHASYEKESAGAGGNATNIDDVPPAITAFFAAPYALGSQLVGLLSDTGGNQAVNDALKAPPADDVQLLDPFRFLHHATAETVAPQKLDKGDRRLDDSAFGAVTLYLVLAGRIDRRAALQAADAWDGESSLDYKHDGRSCVRVAIAAAGTTGADSLESALTAWKATLPGANAAVSRFGSIVSFQSCDPGEKGAAPTGRGTSVDTLTLPSIRTEIARGIISQGVTADVSRCISGDMVSTFPMSTLTDPDPSHLDANTAHQIQQFAAACR